MFWLFTTVMQNRERIVRLETKVTRVEWTLNNIDGNVKTLVESEARRSGRESVEN